jgi:hypothetical protein
MYHRVAIQVGPSLTWQWKSTQLSSLDAVYQWLRPSPEIAGEVGARGPSGNERTTSIAVATKSSPNESSQGVNALKGKGVSPLDKRREELERGGGGDHDLPYSFALPPSMPQVLAWMRLLAKVQLGEPQP